MDFFPSFKGDELQIIVLHYGQTIVDCVVPNLIELWHLIAKFFEKNLMLRERVHNLTLFY